MGSKPCLPDCKCGRHRTRSTKGIKCLPECDCYKHNRKNHKNSFKIICEMCKKEFLSKKRKQRRCHDCPPPCYGYRSQMHHPDCDGNSDENSNFRISLACRKATLDPSLVRYCSGFGNRIHLSLCDGFAAPNKRTSLICNAAYVRMSKFGITTIQWFMMRDLGCGICGQTELKQKREFSVDHDHSCCSEKGKTCGNCVRGVLCGKCNVGIGMFDDDTEKLIKAVDYLTKYNLKLEVV